MSPEKLTFKHWPTAAQRPLVIWPATAMVRPQVASVAAFQPTAEDAFRAEIYQHGVGLGTHWPRG